MPSYMLDTDTVSFALRGYGRVAANLLAHRPSEIFVSSITLAELRFGAESKRSVRLHRLIDTFMDSVAVLPFD
jgi:tRNA(fMet)-specific endonuclease VapC